MNWEYCFHSLAPKEAYTFPMYHSPGGLCEDKSLPHLWQFNNCTNLLSIGQRQGLERAWSFQCAGWRLIPMWNFMLVLWTPGQKLLLVWMRKLCGSQSYGPQTNSSWWFSTKLLDKWRCWASNSSSSSEIWHHTNPGSIFFTHCIYSEWGINRRHCQAMSVTYLVTYQWHPTYQMVSTWDWNECNTLSKVAQ